MRNHEIVGKKSIANDAVVITGLVNEQIVQIDPIQQIVFVDLPAANGATAGLLLPNVGASDKFEPLSIRVKTAGGTASTVVVADDSGNELKELSLANQAALFMHDGFGWYLLSSSGDPEEGA